MCWIDTILLEWSTVLQRERMNGKNLKSHSIIVQEEGYFKGLRYKVTDEIDSRWFNTK